MTDDDSGPLDALPAWRFAIRIYSETKVPESLIFLQNRLGLDVSLFLFLLHLSFVQGKFLDKTDVESLRRFIADWHDQVVTPLRAVRQAMKKSGDLFGSPAILAFRNVIATTELKAEQIEMALCQNWVTSRMASRSIRADAGYEGVAEIASMSVKNADASLRDHNVTEAINIVGEAITRTIASLAPFR